jgi:hypothetical protein
MSCPIVLDIDAGKDRRQESREVITANPLPDFRQYCPSKYREYSRRLEKRCIHVVRPRTCRNDSRECGPRLILEVVGWNRNHVIRPHVRARFSDFQEPCLGQPVSCEIILTTGPSISLKHDKTLSVMDNAEVRMRAYDSRSKADCSANPGAAQLLDTPQADLRERGRARRRPITSRRGTRPKRQDLSVLNRQRGLLRRCRQRHTQDEVEEQPPGCLHGNAAYTSPAAD